MARTEITPVQITLTGITPGAGTAGDAVNGNVVLNNDGESLFVVVNNSGASPFTCTFVTTATVGQAAYAVADEVKTLAAGETKWYGPFPRAIFGNQLEIDVTDAAVKLSPYRM